MYIRKTTKRYKGGTYANYLLVESVPTARGPRQRTICSLGSLAPGPADNWFALAHKLQAALSRQLHQEGANPDVEAPTESEAQRPASRPTSGAALVSVRADHVAIEQVHESGTVHVGHQVWRRLGLDEVLAQANLPMPAIALAEMMTLNRLIASASERARSEWPASSALPEILGMEPRQLADDGLSGTVDLLHPRRAEIETAMAEREERLFNLDRPAYLYDLTSTYTGGGPSENPRHPRPADDEVVVGLALDEEGNPKAHEVFRGSREDGTTVGQMLDRLRDRSGEPLGATVVVDRAMASTENLRQITDRGYRHIVVARPEERSQHVAVFEADGDWQEVPRTRSRTGPVPETSRAWIKHDPGESRTWVLCRKDDPQEKDKNVRRTQEAQLVRDLTRLQTRIAAGRLQTPAKIYEAIGRLKERHPRVARYFRIEYRDESGQIHWSEDTARRTLAANLNGAYVLRTDRADLQTDDIWRLYSILTRVEPVFRALKSPFWEQPPFDQIEHRVETHVFLCVLAYHLLVAIEKTARDRGLDASWAKLCEQLSTYQVATVVLPTADGQTIRVRTATPPDPAHRRIVDLLQIPAEHTQPCGSWAAA